MKHTPPKGEKSQIVDQVLTFFIPSAPITEPSWQKKWSLQQREQFLRYARYFFLVVFLAYIANYFFFDVPMNLEPKDFWLKLRFSIAGMSLLCVAYYASPLTRTRLYKLPAILACSIICYVQAKIAVWFHADAWVFFYIILMTFTLFLSLGVAASLGFVIFISMIGAPPLRQAGITTEYIVSATIVTLAFTAITRRTLSIDVQNFILSEQNMANQKRIADISNEFAVRIQTFIPRVIAERMTEGMDAGMSVVEATIEALKARKKNITCLFTDIRGFTQGSKDLDTFVVESVMPEVTACSNEIELYFGIPRKIGDLIFAYFDDDNTHLNVLRGITAAVAVSRLNESMNATAAQVEVRRYILIATGEAIVGNFGGLDSSVEITALGTPVNFLSRVDDITKTPELREILTSGDVILSDEAHTAIVDLGVKLAIQEIDIKLLGLTIRDFPEVTCLYKLTPNATTEEILATFLTEAENER